MEDEERQVLQETAASGLVMRDILVRLLAYEAKRHEDQRKFFEEFSATTANRIRKVGEGIPVDATTISFQEALQLAIDDVLSSARRVAAGLQGPGRP